MGVLKTLPGLAYQVLLASPGIGHRVGASPKVLGAISKKISTRSDVVHGGGRALLAALSRAPTGEGGAAGLPDVPLARLPVASARPLRRQAPDDADAVAQRRGGSGVRRGAVESVAKHADDVRFEELADSGHFPPQERPDLVAEQLRAFFSARRRAGKPRASSHAAAAREPRGRAVRRAGRRAAQPSRRGRVPSMRAAEASRPHAAAESLRRRMPVALDTAELAAQTKFPRL